MAYFRIETTPDANDRIYNTVAANSQEDRDFVIPNGETYRFIRFYGNSSTAPQTLVCIAWDVGGVEEQVLYVTHGEGILTDPLVDIAGNGVKKLTITLRNDLSESEWLGGGWEAVIL